ncbi:lipopolysaccharide biosynthesis protein [Rhodoferax sp.]|uniref:lipopolysaccharide biosynthesis protein n=1 Tax=Rhodoferax sp. TaxID=50421 RepID=UPI002ACD50B1|nr:lipopolysaccharide biosynthesis protein [Rhodoferax sp.]MDZ7919083.1 lipopolysaccharide biosynthesis protein [Rhodoferax sp.]
MTANLKQRTANALIWSLIQSWSVKVFTLLLFFVLARYLTPAEMGLAQTVTVLLALVAVFSEQGFHSALVQRQGLRSVDVNLPFLLVTAVACSASVVMYVFADHIAALLKEPTSSNLLRVAAFIPPITAANGIAIAMLRRELEFKSIAKATFSANLTAGLLALFLVTQGWGPMALVIQAVSSGLILSIQIWARPGWKPTFRIDKTHFKSLTKFSSASFASQLIDFFSSRLVDIIILSRLGVAALGVYAVGAKLYLTLLELLATALMSVAMSAMSKLLTDRERLKKTYLKFVFLASCTTMPLFVAISALAPEICEILFGGKWKESASIIEVLCLIGAVQVVQFFNGAALDATGKPQHSLAINLFKLIAGFLMLALYPTNSTAELIGAFAISQLCVTPVSFTLAAKATNSSAREVFAQVLPGTISSLLALILVAALRKTTELEALPSWQAAAVAGTTFSITYALTLYSMSRKKLLAEINGIISALKK